MGNLFSKPKSVKAPEVKSVKASPPPPPPTATAEQAGESVKRRKPSGRLATFLTGDLVPEQTKKTKLG
jgi:hypothetical protein